MGGGIIYCRYFLGGIEDLACLVKKLPILNHGLFWNMLIFDSANFSLIGGNS